MRREDGINMSKFKVGDKVIVKGSHNESRYGDKSWDDVVAKVGRKYVYLKGRYGHESETAYDATTGHQKPSRYPGSERSIYLPQEWADRQRRAQVDESIRSHGFKPDGCSGFKQSTKTLERVLAALEDGDD